MCIYVCEYICAYMYANIYVNLCVHAAVVRKFQNYSHMFTRRLKLLYMHIHMYVYLYLHLFIHSYLFIFLYLCTHIHMFIHRRVTSLFSFVKAGIYSRGCTHKWNCLWRTGTRPLACDSWCVSAVNNSKYYYKRYSRCKYKYKYINTFEQMLNA